MVLLYIVCVFSSAKTLYDTFSVKIDWYIVLCFRFLQADIRDYGIKSENCPLYGEPYRCPVAIVVISKKTGSRTILAACKSGHLILKTPRKPASENVVCLCWLLNILANLFLHTGK